MPCLFFTAHTLHDTQKLLEKLNLRDQAQEGNANIETTVASILEDVKTNGLEAVVNYTRKFDAPNFSHKQFLSTEKHLDAALASIPSNDLAIIKQAIENIDTFHREQKAHSWVITKEDGSLLGQRHTPVDRAGLYVPGGKGGSTPLISSLLMNAIPAIVAGVKEIAVISPPQQDGFINPYILACAKLLGIREVYAAGSAWGIGALAFGAGELRPVDVIAGPGNIFVTTAKRMLIGKVGIDMIAGPSEILVLADAGANPAWVAADMLSQAEHDPLASAICLCTDLTLCESIMQELKKQVEALPRAKIAAESLEQFGAVIYTPEIDTAIEICNAIAAEHLELLVAEPFPIAAKVRHAGAIFMGYYAAEPLGDYFAGPNHVLPTMGTARFSSALGVDTFCKKTSIIFPSKKFAAENSENIARLARLEGLEGHARSALLRQK